MNPFLRSLLVTLAATSTALAQQAPSSSTTATSTPGAGPASQPSRSGTHPTPPPEAVAACSGKAVGASCTFLHKERTETGSCFTPDPAQAVACKPVRPPRDAGPAPAAR